MPTSERGQQGQRARLRVALFALCTTLFACSKINSNGQAANPTVILETSAGNITLVINTEAAPITAENFLRYVDGARYDSGRFYRTVRDDNQAQNSILIDVIQGGIGLQSIGDAFAPVAHETTERTGLKHLNGTISLARGAPGTGGSEFFICIGPQPALDFGGMRNPDGLGFAAFGRVISGMSVVQQIHAMPTVQPQDAELEYTSGQMLVEPVRIISARRAR